MSFKSKSTPSTEVESRRKSLRIHGRVAREIGIQIMAGEYKPGERLNGEVAASDELQVSRTAYREAMRILSAKGLVESRPKTGTWVSEKSNWRLLDPDVLSWIFASEPDEALLASLFELRRIVEPEAAALAAARRDQSHIDRMAAGLAGMAEYTLATEKGRAADQDFHTAMMEAANNPFLTTLTSGVGAAVAWTTIFKQRRSALPRDPMPDHQQVFDAVAAGDTEWAHRAMLELVESAYRDTQRASQAPRG